jgi:hypothetical protein
MHIVARCVGLAAVLFAACAAAEDKPGVIATDSAEAVLTVRGVNYVERTVTFANADGELSTIKVPDEAQNLDQVYAGARFHVTYLRSVVIGVIPGGNQPAASEVEKVELAPKGATPGGAVVNVKQVTALVEGVNYESRTVAVRGPSGNLQRFDVSPDVERFDNIQVGDTVLLRYTEALGLKMIKE